ncbi:odorant receptor 4-like isoform X2 [Ooceraea biroi]|uniref:odorant receptor 4-like isoform X2 n=1 Tax=Ooceraea biroi TaxID=2015173 RepID=UPI000F07DD5E|nr:odorant receptor 4-like isoform X2 [Ooceraea biroi]
MYKTSILVQEYFSLNRIALLAVGLWPYQQSKFAPCQAALCLSILTSFVIFVLSRLCFVEYSFEFTIHLLSISTYYTFFLMNYISFWINIKTIRYILEQFQYIYKRLKDSKEIAIYNKYGNIAKRLTLAFTIGICDQVYLTVIQCWPYICDIIVPKNVTYARHIIVTLTTYFAIQERFFYLFLLYLNVVFTVGTTAIVAIGTMLLSCFKHICGILRIASYRFEQAITATLQSITIKNETMIYKEFICAVDIHRKAMEIAKIVVGDMERSLFIVITSTVLCMSLNLYAILQVESPMQEIEKIVGYLFTIICLFLYMFVINYAGQEITDCNNHIFLTVYNTPWYLVPSKIQKLILFLLQRSNKAFTLNFGGLFILSIESFVSLVSTSVSYFTLMLSLQE